MLAALFRERTGLRVTALGSQALAVAGAEVIASSHDIAVMGFGEVATNLVPCLLYTSDAADDYLTV